MAISHVIAHHLSRIDDQTATLNLRSDELALSDHKDDLLDELKRSFLSRLARKHGSFKTADEGEPSLLQTALEQFLAETHSFSQMSVVLMQAFEHGLNESDIELDAYFLFFLEQVSDHHSVFYLYIVNQSQSLAINESLEVTPSYSVDTGPSMVGIKVDLSEWKVRKNYAYLSFLPPRGSTPFAELFTGITGFGDGLNTTEATQSFLAGVDAFAKQVPQEAVNDYRAKVVDYCMSQEQKDEPVTIAGLSKELEGIDCEKFVREMAPYNPKGEEEIKVDRRELRRYVKFMGRDKDLSISFSTYHLHSRVLYDEESDTLTIKGLPNALRNQLLAHLKN